MQKPFYYVQSVSLSKAKTLYRWVKQYKKFDAYAEIEEVKRDKYDVKLFCGQVYTDRLGNRALKQLS